MDLIHNLYEAIIQSDTNLLNIDTKAAFGLNIYTKLADAGVNIKRLAQYKNMLMLINYDLNLFRYICARKGMGYLAMVANIDYKQMCRYPENRYLTKHRFYSIHDISGRFFNYSQHNNINCYPKISLRWIPIYTTLLQNNLIEDNFILENNIIPKITNQIKLDKSHQTFFNNVNMVRCTLLLYRMRKRVINWIGSYKVSDNDNYSYTGYFISVKYRRIKWGKDHYALYTIKSSWETPYMSPTNIITSIINYNCDDMLITCRNKRKCYLCNVKGSHGIYRDLILCEDCFVKIDSFIHNFLSNYLIIKHLDPNLCKDILYLITQYFTIPQFYSVIV